MHIYYIYKTFIIKKKTFESYKTNIKMYIATVCIHICVSLPCVKN